LGSEGCRAKPFTQRRTIKPEVDFEMVTRKESNLSRFAGDQLFLSSFAQFVQYLVVTEGSDSDPDLANLSETRADNGNVNLPALPARKLGSAYA